MAAISGSDFSPCSISECASMYCSAVSEHVSVPYFFLYFVGRGRCGWFMAYGGYKLGAETEVYNVLIFQTSQHTSNGNVQSEWVHPTAKLISFLAHILQHLVVIGVLDKE